MTAPYDPYLRLDGTTGTLRLPPVPAGATGWTLSIDGAATTVATATTSVPRAGLTPGPHTVRGLARILGVSKPVVTRALNTLGTLGYLRRERDQDDRRNVFVVRTSNGADFLEGFKRLLRSDGTDAGGPRAVGAGSPAAPPSPRTAFARG